MAAYILRRLLLIIPTLLGIMIVNFGVIQLAPGGPVEQMVAQIQGLGGSATDRFTGGGAETNTESSEKGSYRGAQGLDPENIAALQAQYGFVDLICEEGYEGPRRPSAKECHIPVTCEAGYDGPQELSARECEAVKLPAHTRFFRMLGNYISLDFGDSYFRSKSVIDLVLEKMPVSISLGLWTTLIAYLISIPLGIRKAVHDGSGFDTWTSGLVIIGYAIPAFLFAVLLRVVFAGGSFFENPPMPLRGLESDQWVGKPFLPDGLGWIGNIGLTFFVLLLLLAAVLIFDMLLRRRLPGRSMMIAMAVLAIGALPFLVPALSDPRYMETKAFQFDWWLDYLWHLVLPVSAMIIGAFATLTLLTKNSFLDEIKKQYVLTARAKGLTENTVLFGHVFRNAMLIVVAGFPAAFVGVFFTGSLLIETIFSLDGLGLLGYTSVVERDYPVVFGTLFIFSLIGLVLSLISDLVYVWIDPRIDFESREV